MGVPPERWFVLDARGPEGPDDGRIAEGLLALGGQAVEEVAGWLTTYLDAPEADLADLRAGLVGLTGIEDLEVRGRWQRAEDWTRRWKEGLAPRRVGSRFLITPTWCDPVVEPDDLVITLDPGMAFGNAEHGTTRGCLRLLETVVRPGDRVQDVGAGSGVLAIAAALLGASRVLAVEADPSAVPTARENVDAHGLGDRVTVVETRADAGSVAASGVWDGIVANIETGVLTPLLPGFAVALRPGGWLVLSGILADQLEPLVAEAARHGLERSTIDEDGEWRSILLRA